MRHAAVHTNGLSSLDSCDEQNCVLDMYSTSELLVSVCTLCDMGTGLSCDIPAPECDDQDTIQQLFKCWWCRDMQNLAHTAQSLISWSCGCVGHESLVMWVCGQALPHAGVPRCRCVQHLPGTVRGVCHQWGPSCPTASNTLGPAWYITAWCCQHDTQASTVHMPLAAQNNITRDATPLSQGPGTSLHGAASTPTCQRSTHCNALLQP